MMRLNRQNRPLRSVRGFTLVECICAITVISVVSAVVLPVIHSATTSYVSAARARDVSENVAFALDRCVGLLRRAPIAPGSDDLYILAATPTSIRFGDNRELSYAGGVLSMTDSDGITAPLLRNIDSFSIGYFAQDGVTSTSSSPEESWVCVVGIRSAGFELRTSVFLRAGEAAP